MVSIPIPLACEASALPYDLHPHDIGNLYKLDKCNGFSILQEIIHCENILNVNDSQKYKN